MASKHPRQETIIVDRDARRTAAEILRHFINGQLSNDAFEDAEPVTSDPSIRAMWDTAWLFYSDMEEHKLVGRHRMHPATKRECLRWILFLDTDLPYEWPSIRHAGNDPAARDAPGLPERLMDTFRAEKYSDKIKKFEQTGHYPVWPFVSQQDYRHALRNPRRLGSGR